MGARANACVKGRAAMCGGIRRFAFCVLRADSAFGVQVRRSMRDWPAKRPCALAGGMRPMTRDRPARGRRPAAGCRPLRLARRGGYRQRASSASSARSGMPLSRSASTVRLT
ncbi:hypothetical protein AQ731_19670 [Burkholderia pseudomallei]|nr:hypothetical protein UQ47_03390 [Burkholderia pseudomallei]KIX65270.1 hypothetical protein SZ30_25600 [Burkholderia pseudomallei]KJR95279.1 hypothetical protein VP95_02900 [Burkholderia pseudomallei]OMR11836.1 hypothetical protein AQ718_21020 [Burkholderia pseudomallei]OMR56325.1 hypothetical protein AQ726_05630 [Burkholderia pseudomallei]